MDFERRLYYYGLGVGVPYGALSSLANAVDVTRHAPELARRRRVARDLLVKSSWRGFISRDGGYALIDKQTLPGTSEAIEAVNHIIEDRRRTGWKARDNNPFYQLERPEDFRNHPELLKFVLSDAVLQIVSDYYGMVPQLKEVGVWLTPPQQRQFSSQLYHLDKPEAQILGLFLNADATEEDAGPLTLLPAHVSQKIRRNTHYESVYFRGDGRLSDEVVFAHCSPGDQIVLGGAAGTGGFADTSNCFHFGSRCRSGERKLLVAKFQLPHKARNPRTPLFDFAPKPVDEARQLILSGAVFRSD